MFDWDGTLWDSKTLNYNSVATIFRHFGLRPPTMEEYFSEASAVNDLLQFYKNHGIRNANLKNLESIRGRYFRAHWGEAPLYDGTPELLQLCESLGMFTAVVSGQAQKWIVKVLAANNMILFFNNVHGGVRDKEEALIQQLDDWGLKAEEAFYLDDTYEGISAAKKLGITAIGITHGFHKKPLIQKACPDFIADSLYEVIEILKNGGRA